MTGYTVTPVTLILSCQTNRSIICTVVTIWRNLCNCVTHSCLNYYSNFPCGMIGLHHNSKDSRLHLPKLIKVYNNLKNNVPEEELKLYERLIGIERSVVKITTFLNLKCLHEWAQKIKIFTKLTISAILNLNFFRKKRGHSIPPRSASKTIANYGQNQILQHNTLVFAANGGKNYES